MSSHHWNEQFETIVRAALPLLADESALAPDAALADLGLDSLETVNLLVTLEEAFEVVIPDGDLTPETFATPSSLWSTLDRLRSHSQPSR